MPTAVETIQSSFSAVRNVLFFAAVIALNYTLSRPSPVDMLFAAALFTSVLVNQPVRPVFILFFLLLLSWVTAFMLASFPFLGDPEVASEVFKKSFVVVLGLSSAYISMSWNRLHFRAFIKIYVFSCVLGASIGLFGFLFGVEQLTWDGRARGFFDDPNMFSSFLVPGVICCLYLIHTRQGRKLFLVPAMTIICFGVLFAFSRAAYIALLISCTGFVIFLNRDNLLKLVPYVVGIVAVGTMLLLIAFFGSEDFSEKFLERATVAKSYDLGREGRYARYARSIPMILENPVGLGIKQQEKIFVEPIHNIFLSSFLNYGWLGGISWLTIFSFSIVIGVTGFRSTRDEIPIVLLLGVVAPVMCAFLHEGEHWRHLWMFLGLLWGFNVRNFAKSAKIPLRGAPRYRPAQIGLQSGGRSAGPRPA